MINKNNTKLVISPNTPILDALKRMDEVGRKLLLVLNNNSEYKGLVTIGDIQRAVINSLPLSTPVNDIIRDDLKIASPEDSFDSIKNMMLKLRMEYCPVVNTNKKVDRIYYWEDLFTEEQQKAKTNFDLPVVIMAGGYGSRLRPITNVLPKPLIPISEKSMLEEIMSRFNEYGTNDFYISVNYKAELIEFYLESLQNQWNFTCFTEPKPLGTAGSLSLLKDKIDTTFFVSNCDILIDEDYDEILKYHREQKNEITAVAALKNFSIPYGTLETKEGGQLVGMEEKPDFTFKINSGMYVLEPHLLDEIPTGSFFHITHLMDKIMKRDGRVGVFPVSENSWTDMGDWSEYLKQIKNYKKQAKLN